ncbi:MAG: acetyl-CoA C-acyltransferase, partial [Pseudohongiellaceae bacterium]|nr:acetyl-CoA C-acyltransferase [Pseudohongiellaceae bacterium]
NSTALTDGASSVFLASEEYAQKNNLPVLAWLSQARTSAIDFVAGQGLLMAPTIAVSELLSASGMTLQDFSLYEIHEAFAAQVLCTLKAWEDQEFCQEQLGLEQALGSIDLEKLNIHGSSLAYGHPFAATGARILASLSKDLSQLGKGHGLISICTAGGMGAAAILSAPDTPL